MPSDPRPYRCIWISVGTKSASQASSRNMARALSSAAYSSARARRGERAGAAAASPGFITKRSKSWRTSPTRSGARSTAAASKAATSPCRASGARTPLTVPTPIRRVSSIAAARSRWLKLSIRALSGGPALLPPGHLPEQQLVAARGEEGVLHAPQRIVRQAGGHPIHQGTTPDGQLGELLRGVHPNPLHIPFVRWPWALCQALPYVGTAPHTGQKSGDELRKLVQSSYSEKEVGVATRGGGLLLRL